MSFAMEMAETTQTESEEFCAVVNDVMILLSMSGFLEKKLIACIIFHSGYKFYDCLLFSLIMHGVEALYPKNQCKSRIGTKVDGQKILSDSKFKSGSQIIAHF